MSSTTEPAPPLRPPFTEETARKKVKAAQALWNTCDPTKVVKAYTEDSIWRNRDQFLKGHDEIEAFLVKKWQREKCYRLRKEMFCFAANKIAVQFWYEYKHEDKWYRCYGLEDWTFSEDGTGRMWKRMMSGNEITITEEERWFTSDKPEDWDNVEISDRHW